MTELCARYDISRTGYKWLARYDAGGRPPRGPGAARPTTVRTRSERRVLLLTARRRHPDWGPEKLLDWLAPAIPASTWPATSTAGDLLARQGLVKKRAAADRRITGRRAPVQPPPLTICGRRTSRASFAPATASTAIR